MNKPFDVRSCIALQYKTAIPGATLKTPGQEQIQPSFLLGLLSHMILKPTEVFLLYICVLTTLSNYAGGLGCEADCQLELGQYTNISIYCNTDNRNIISIHPITVSIYRIL